MAFKLIKTEQSDINKKLDSQVNKTSDPLPKNPILWVIVGQKGSGKSTLLLNSLNSKKAYRKHFDNIYFISPTAKKDSKFDKLVKELDKNDNFYTSLSDETLQEIRDKLEDNRDNDETSLLIIDDCIHQLPGNGQKNSILNELITTSRHLKLTIIICTQKFNYINTLIRNNTDIISFFPTDKKIERNAFMEEFNIPEELYEFCCDKPNNFIHVSMSNNKKTYFKNFDRIL